MSPESSNEPTRSVEIEQKFDAADGVVMPDWQVVLPGVHRCDPETVRDLDALYFDTEALDLARAGVAVRRRTGGPDAGWHIKGPIHDGGRTEWGWPLGEGDAPPAAVVQALSPWTEEPLRPLARIRNERHPFILRDASGGVIAEVVDDHVEATDLRGGAVRRWREWEVELGPAAPADREAFFAAATAAALAAGATAPSSASKLARALGA